MPVSYVNDFTRGALSPLFKGRSDLPIYRRGCQMLHNMYVLPTGGAVKVPGTLWVTDAPGTASDPVRLTTMVYDDDNPYVLEWSDELVRFYKDGDILGAPYSLVSPYDKTHLEKLRMVQGDNDANKLWIFHSSYDPRQLTRTNDTSWAFSTVSWTGQTFTGSGNRPRAACIYQQRLWLLKGTTIYASKTNSRKNFTVGAMDADAIELPIDGFDMLWLCALRNEIIVGCTNGLLRIHSNGQAMAPGTVVVEPVSDVGAGNIQGRQCMERLIYVARDRRTVMEYNPFAQEARDRVRNLSLLGSHYIGWYATSSTGMTEIKELHIQQAPFRAILCVTVIAGTRYGGIIGCTYEPENDVLAWYVHHSANSPYVWTMAVAPPIQTSPHPWQEDKIMIACHRSGDTTMYIVEQSPYQWWLASTGDPFTYNFMRIAGTGTDMSHLPNGTTVGVINGDDTQPNQVITAGAITGSSYAGLRYTAAVAPMPMVPESSGRRMARVHHVVVRLAKTKSFKAFPELTPGDVEASPVTASYGEERILEEDLIGTNSVVDDKTATDWVPVNGKYDQDVNLFIVNDEPQPLMVLSVAAEVEEENA